MKKIAIVDIETTGMLNQGGLIVEIGIVGLDLETGEVVNEFSEIVKEAGFGERHTKAPFGWIFQNSNLNYNDVLSATGLAEMLPEIQRVLGKYPLGATAFNKSFDFGFLKSRGLKIKELPCIMLAATPMINLPPNPGYNTPKWPTVEEAWDHFFPTKQYDMTHRGLDDAKHESLIAYEIYKKGGFSI